MSRFLWFTVYKPSPAKQHHKCLALAVAEMGDRLATTDIGRKWGGAVPLWGGGELRPHVTQCGLGRGLPSHQVAS